MNASLNNSLSDLLDMMEPESDLPLPKESCTISTKDSKITSKKKKKTKRGNKKLAMSMPALDFKTSNDDVGTVATMDSMEEKAKKKKKSKRGGKKKDMNKLSASLSDLLVDEEEEDDEPRISTPAESLTVNTLDSMEGKYGQKEKKSKRGGKKKKKEPTSLGSVLNKLDGPKDYGRDSDDNDTFCGLGTVGEKELRKLSNSPKKTKIVSPLRSTPQPFSMMRMGDDDSDEDEEEDLFQGFDNNPFRKPSYL